MCHGQVFIIPGHGMWVPGLAAGPGLSLNSARDPLVASASLLMLGGHP